MLIYLAVTITSFVVSTSSLRSRCSFDGTKADCSSRDLAEVPQFTEKMRNMKALNLNNNSLEALPNQAFGQLLQIRNISVAGNHLDFVNTGAFITTPTQSHSSVQRIDFSGNHLHNVPAAFRHIDHDKVDLPSLHNVIYLNLAQNDIGPNLEENSLGGLRYLEALDMSSNNIKNVEARTFRRMEKLSMVDLSYNFIENIPESLFHRRSALHTLRLACNNIAQIPFGLPQAIESLDMSFNQISTVSLIGSRNLRTLTQARKFNLSSNGLENIEVDAFFNMAELRVLDLSNNKLYTLPSEIFYGTELVEEIYLNGNPHLEFLPSDIFINLQHLRFLFLHGCGLKNLEIGQPSVSPFSQRFILAPVTSLTAEINPSYASRLQAIWLFGNPFNCNCELLPLVWFINRRGILLDANADMLKARGYGDEIIGQMEFFKPEGNNTSTICATPLNRHDEVAGRRVVDVPESHLICPDQPFYIILSMCLGIALFTLSVPTVFVLSLIGLRCVELVKYHLGTLSED